MITVVGLGPAGLGLASEQAIQALTDPSATVIVRTARHPAAVELSARRSVSSCDDLYDSAPDFDALYEAIAERVCSTEGHVIYAVPGSPSVGERSVPLVKARALAAGRFVEVIGGLSFLDLALERLGLDPIVDGLQILDARALPDPMPLHLPTLITQFDTPATAADLAVTLGRVLEHDVKLTALVDLGSPDEQAIEAVLGSLHEMPTGPRATLYLSPQEVGWSGLVRTNRTLRSACPWDREQTHQSLLKHLVEEAYETVDAIEHLSAEAPRGDPDFGAYAAVEEELGDLLLQVVFHSTLAAEAGAFDVEEVAEGIRRKLVARHPHVFGDLQLDGPAAVEANWERLKAAEKRRESVLDDIPAALPGLARAEKLQRRAASVGFDWPDVSGALAKLHEEVAELADADSTTAATEELGDVIFAAVNVARHLGVDPESALRGALRRFESRFRWVEKSVGAEHMAAAGAAGLDDLWQAAKSADREAEGEAD